MATASSDLKTVPHTGHIPGSFSIALAQGRHISPVPKRTDALPASCFPHRSHFRHIMSPPATQPPIAAPFRCTCPGRRIARHEHSAGNQTRRRFHKLFEVARLTAVKAVPEHAQISGVVCDAWIRTRALHGPPGFLEQIMDFNVSNPRHKGVEIELQGIAQPSRIPALACHLVVGNAFVCLSGFSIQLFICLKST